MSRELAVLLWLALSIASVALWLRDAIDRAFRDLRVTA